MVRSEPKIDSIRPPRKKELLNDKVDSKESEHEPQKDLRVDSVLPPGDPNSEPCALKVYSQGKQRSVVDTKFQKLEVEQAP